jgi:hypothetical protein
MQGARAKPRAARTAGYYMGAEGGRKADRRTRINVSDLEPRIDLDPQVFYTYFYNHARRLRLEK